MATVQVNNREQITIKNWFEKTYMIQGFQYLRPKVAYCSFITHLQAKENSMLLDVACGPGLMLKVAEENNIKPWGIDLSETAIDMCKNYVKSAEAQVGNAMALPYEEKSFDYITCLGALERMLDLDAVLQEQKRVAKEDAKFCYMVRNSENIMWAIKTTFGMRNKKGHQGAKSLQEWKDVFDKNGFEILSIHKDTWRLVRWMRWFTLGTSLIDYYKLRSIPVSLNKSYEFIFILKKK